MASLHEPEIVAVESAFDRLLGSLTGATDAMVRELSLLPGWTRGHVLTHLARNADGNRNMVEGALHGEEREQYPGGASERAGEIEAGASRNVDELIVDLVESQRSLVAAWRMLTPEQWSSTGVWLNAGRQTIDASLGSRRREVLVHVVDLDVGVRPTDLPADFLDDEHAWLAEHRTVETWPDASW
jgi:maleylpyruvate isomerase